MRIILTISSFFIFCGLFAQHTPLVGHYLNNQMPLNPGFTGYQGSPEVNLSFRKQWMKLEGSPNTQLLSYSTRFKDDKNAIGFIMSRDEIGISSSFGFNASYAHVFKLTKTLNWSLGAAAGIQSLRNNWSLINTTDPNDLAFMLPSSSLIAPYASFGTVLFNKKFFVSLSVLNLITSVQKGASLETGSDFANHTYYMGGGFKHTINADLDLNYGLLVKYHQVAPIQADVTISAEYKQMFKGGVSYRSGDALILLVGYNVNQQFSIGYQYDLTLSALAPYNSGSHEINLRYLFKFYHYTANPQFF